MHGLVQAESRGSDSPGPWSGGNGPFSSVAGSGRVLWRRASSQGSVEVAMLLVMVWEGALEDAVSTTKRELKMRMVRGKEEAAGSSVQKVRRFWTASHLSGPSSQGVSGAPH